MAEEVRTMVPGNIWKVLVAVGDTVTAGQTLFIMDVMKTEVAHEATTAGIVTAVHVTEGQEGVEGDELAVVIG
jgi:biotin carboxyl carrier protein